MIRRPAIRVAFGKLTDKQPEPTFPRRAYSDDVGLDVSSYLINDDGRAYSISLGPNTTRRVPTKLVVAPPPGFAITVYSRSDLAEQSIFVANAPGLLDPGYDGELFVLLHNSGYQTMLLGHDTRIAQLVLIPILDYDVVKVDKIVGGARGDAGFGSIGQ